MPAHTMLSISSRRRYVIESSADVSAWMVLIGVSIFTSTSMSESVSESEWRERESEVDAQ